MKKKIINGIMMVALVAATSTSFVSCKDTNEDVRVEQAAEIAALQGRLATLENKYGDLDGRIKAQTERLNNHAAAIETLQKEVDELEVWLLEAFAKLVTSVELSGTYTNMIGSVNVPGFEPKMLISNWGVAAQRGVFPKSANDFGLTKEETISWAANDELGTGAYEEGGNPGFAGFIYAAVNRYLNSVPLLSEDQDEDLGMFNFSLVNTAGEEAEGVEITNFNEDGEGTDDILKWGWTRAEDNNTFKFAVAYTGGEAKNFKPAKINLRALKDDLKLIWRDRNASTGTSKKALARTLADLYYNYATMDTNAAKYALKIAWKDNESGQYDDDDEYAYNEDTQKIDFEENEVEDFGIEHFVTSKHELVFATIEPLGFNSGEAITYKTNAVIGETQYLGYKGAAVLNKLFDKVKKQLPDLSPAQIKTIIGDGANLKYTAATDKWELNAGVAGWIDVTSLIAPLNASLENVQDMMAAAQQLENKALNAATYYDWYYKFSSNFAKIIERNANQALQPVLLAVNNGVVNRVSRLKYAPYEASGEVTLKPTTYTIELLAPAYAKFVGCKDIEEDNFNKILFSNSDELKFTPEPGKLYEIVYEAVDYFGNIIDDTYYIQGK